MFFTQYSKSSDFENTLYLQNDLVLIDSLVKNPEYIYIILSDSSKLEINKLSYYDRQGFPKKFIKYFKDNDFKKYSIDLFHVVPEIKDCKIEYFISKIIIKSKKTNKRCEFAFKYYPDIYYPKLVFIHLFFSNEQLWDD